VQGLKLFKGAATLYRMRAEGIHFPRFPPMPCCVGVCGLVVIVGGSSSILGWLGALLRLMCRVTVCMWLGRGGLSQAHRQVERRRIFN